MICITRFDAQEITESIWEEAHVCKEGIFRGGGWIKKKDRRCTKRVRKMLTRAADDLEGITLTGNESRRELESIVRERVSGGVPLLVSIFAPFLIRWMVTSIVDFLIHRYFFGGPAEHGTPSTSE